MVNMQISPTMDLFTIHIPSSFCSGCRASILLVAMCGGDLQTDACWHLVRLVVVFPGAGVPLGGGSSSLLVSCGDV
jgi:hypothetical protein